MRFVPGKAGTYNKHCREKAGTLVSGKQIMADDHSL